MITKKTTIGELVSKHPETIEYLMSLGLHCVGCHAAYFETLEQGLRMHGLSEKKINDEIKKLNKIIKNAK